MNRLGLGFFKLRLFIYIAFSCFFWAEGSHVGAMFVWFIFAQIEYLLNELNLHDEYKSEWEEKLKSLIKHD